MRETIAAIASGMTASGIGIIRISGPDAFRVLGKVFRFANKNKTVENVRPNTIHYGHIIDYEVGSRSDGQVSDTRNRYVRNETVIDEVKQGESLSSSIQRTGIFESMFVSIILVGEESGALDTILAKSAAFYQEESDEAITRLVGLIEPVMIIFMGVCIGAVIAGILPAIYNSMGNIQ